MWRFPTVHGIIRVVITVLSVGGSIIAPDRPDPEFLRAFRAAIGDYLEAHADDRLVFVIGGGAPARIYQQALRDIATAIVLAPEEPTYYAEMASLQLRVNARHFVFIQFHTLIRHPPGFRNGGAVAGQGCKG